MPYKNRLRALREEKDLKQTTVAEDLGLSRTTLSNYEAGMRPSIENAIALAQYYHVSLDYIVGLSAERNSTVGELTTSFAALSGLAVDAAPLPATWRRWWTLRFSINAAARHAGNSRSARGAISCAS